ncbi:MAG: GNAT family N-acetyltransferase [Pirellulaceae bacterium]|nr:GNAT family N-acetyltransferase [Pirellulaceae bacterium]
MTTSLLENIVLSLPFFDRHGLIVATDDQQPVGFVHAGFGPDASGAALDCHTGATCMLMVSHHERRAWIARELLARSEQYLRERGATVLCGGGSLDRAPFYRGLYGGSAVRGVLESDQAMLELLREAGYVQTARHLILQRSLVGFRQPVDRHQVQFRRSYYVELLLDWPPTTWWEACSEGHSERFAYVARPRTGGEPCGTAVCWDIEPLASSWGVHAQGVAHLDLPATPDRESFAVFLLSEAFRLAVLDGVTLVEVQLPATDQPMLRVLEKLGFETVEQAFEFQKQIAS